MGEKRRRFWISLIVLMAVLAHRAPAAPQSLPKPQPPVFGADIAVVAVPVFVTDKNGKAVGGLTAADFEVEDRGRKVPIVAFQALDVDAPVPVTPQAGLSSLAISVQAEGPRQFLLLLDLEFSPPAGAHRGRAAAASFIREQLTPGDQVAVAVWGRNGLRVLTNFTADHERAALALEGKGVANSPGLDPLGLAGGYGTLAPTGVQRTDQEAAEIEALQHQIGREDYATRVGAFLEAVSDLVRNLATLRGRKQLVLLSGGFRQSAWDSDMSQGNRAESAPNLARMQQIFERAGRGDVVFHAVSLYGITESVSVSSRATEDLRTRIDLHSGPFTLSTITEKTGGRFIPPTNDFGRALHEVDRISRKSYVIAFEIDADPRDDKPRALKVRVRREGLSVSHRASYAVSDRTSNAGGGASRTQAAEAIAKGITGGSLPLQITVLPHRDRDGRSIVHAVLEIDGPRLLGAARDGKLDLEVYGYLMRDGGVLDSVAANTSLDLAKMEASILASGVQVLTAFPLASGEADLRFFVRATNSELTGSARQNLVAPVFTEGQTVLSPPLFNVPLAGRVALPLQAGNRPRIEIPFRLGNEPFLPETWAALGANAREVCVFVWPARDAASAFEVNAEIVGPGQARRGVTLDGAPEVVKDSDGFDRYLLRLIGPEAPPGNYTLRLTFRDPETGRSSATETAVWVER